MKFERRAINIKIQELKPIPNVILAWTISPDEIIKKYENKTPTLNRRLEDITSALKDGWNVRICLDPILHVKNWKQIYSEFIEKAFQQFQLRIFGTSVLVVLESMQTI